MIWAQASPPPELVNWTQLGVMGMVILAFFTGWVVSKSTHERALHEVDRLLDRADKKDQHLQDIVIPAFTKAVDALAESNELLREQYRERR